MREGFRDIVEGWLLTSDYRELGETIELAADWVLVHGGPLELQPDERACIIDMLRQHLALGCRLFALAQTYL